MMQQLKTMRALHDAARNAAKQGVGVIGAMVMEEQQQLRRQQQMQQHEERLRHLRQRYLRHPSRPQR